MHDDGSLGVADLDLCPDDVLAGVAVPRLLQPPRHLARAIVRGHGGHS